MSNNMFNMQSENLKLSQTKAEGLSICCGIIYMWKDHWRTSPPLPLLSALHPTPSSLPSLSLPVGWRRTPPEWHLQITRPRVLGPLTREPLLSTLRDSPAFCHIITANPLKVAPLQPSSTSTSNTQAHTHAHTTFLPLYVCRQMHVGA